jgi:glycosyltransferase involved in cell wall biosynthesis
MHDITWKIFIRATANFPNFLLYFVDRIVFLKKKIVGVPDMPKELCINLEWVKKLNIDYNSFGEKKKLWISWIMRIRNWDDFMEAVIESHLYLCDEIIILENKSTDQTSTIGKQLLKKYPDKIQYYEYDYHIYKCFSKEFDSCPWNSVHALAYYINWGYSKARYKYVMKVDDDDLWISSAAKQLRKKILAMKGNRAFYYYWVNLLKIGDEIGISKYSPYLGKNWDHLIYSLSKKTYCLQSYWSELFVQPWRWKRFWLWLLHLKYLKKEYGCINYPEPKKTQWIKSILDGGIDADFKKYDKKLTKTIVYDTLHHFWIKI